MSYFILKYGFTSLTCCDEPTSGFADIWPWHRNRRDSISVTMLRVRSKFSREIWQNSKHDFHLEGSWPIGVHFRWPCLSDFLCMVGGSSDLCRLCPFLSDSADQTTLSRNMRPDSGRRFPLVYMCVLVHQNRKRFISEPSHWNWSVYCICDLCLFILWNNTQIFNFLMLEGVWMIVATAKIFAKQNGGRLVEIVDSVLHRDCYHVIIGINDGYMCTKCWNIVRRHFLQFLSVKTNIQMRHQQFPLFP